MIVNVEKFKKLLKKATLNFLIDNVSLDFSPSRIKSNMINRIKDSISILNMENDVILDMKGEMSLAFVQPNVFLLPYLNLIQTEEAILTYEENKIRLSSGSLKSTVHFCDDNLTIFGSTAPKVNDYFLTISIDENIKEMFYSIKKVANKFGVVYFVVNDGVFYMKTTDIKNKLSNALSFEVCNVDVSDRIIGFDFKNLSQLFNVLDDDHSFSMNFNYIEENDAGMLYVTDDLKTEQYILMSKILEKDFIQD